MGEFDAACEGETLPDRDWDAVPESVREGDREGVAAGVPVLVEDICWERLCVCDGLRVAP